MRVNITDCSTVVTVSSVILIGVQSSKDAVAIFTLQVVTEVVKIIFGGIYLSSHQVLTLHLTFEVSGNTAIDPFTAIKATVITQGAQVTARVVVTNRQIGQSNDEHVVTVYSDIHTAIPGLTTGIAELDIKTMIACWQMLLINKVVTFTNLHLLIVNHQRVVTVYILTMQTYS